MAQAVIPYGSEEVYAQMCDACQDDNILRKAEGYCKNCQEYLCIKCIHHHKSVRLTRSHEIIDITEDIDDVIGQLAETKIEDDFCLDHGKSPIDKYCKNHDEVGCDMCVTLSHNKCDTESISHTLRTFNDTKWNNTMTELKNASSRFTRSRIDTKKAEQNAIKEYKSFLDRQTIQRKQILQQMRMDQIEDEKVKVARLNAFLKSSKLKKKMIGDIIKVVDTLHQQSTEVDQSNNDTKKFITWNKLSKQLGLLDKTLSEVNVTDTSIFEGCMKVDIFYLYKNKAGKSIFSTFVQHKVVSESSGTRYKMLLLGDWDVGKTTFIRRHISGDVSKVYKESLGINVHPITLLTTSGQIAFDVWDTCGQERFGPLRDGIFKGGECALIMFDVSSTTSIHSVTKWYTVLKDQCGYLPVVICGNCLDQSTATVKETNLDVLRKLKLPCLKYQLMSGKTMTNFESPFLTIAQALTSNNTMDIETKCSLYPPDTIGC